MFHLFSIRIHFLSLRRITSGGTTCFLKSQKSHCYLPYPLSLPSNQNNLPLGTVLRAAEESMPVGHGGYDRAALVYAAPLGLGLYVRFRVLGVPRRRGSHGIFSVYYIAPLCPLYTAHNKIHQLSISVSLSVQT